MNEIISGSEFNAIYNNKIYYKLVSISMIHNGYKFEKGLNIDKNEFNNIECGPNGIYFCFGHFIDIWIDTNKKQLIWTVEVPDDARIVVFKNKIKSNKIILKDIVPYDQVMQIEQIKLCEKNVFYLTCFYNEYSYDDKLQKIILDKIKCNAYILKYISKNILTTEIILAALNIDGNLLKFVPKEMLTNEIISAAVNNDGLVYDRTPQRGVGSQICSKRNVDK
jgi:hypothetical protein